MPQAYSESNKQTKAHFIIYLVRVFLNIKHIIIVVKTKRGISKRHNFGSKQKELVAKARDI